MPNLSFEAGLSGWTVRPAPGVLASSWDVVTDPAVAKAGDSYLRWTGDSRATAAEGVEPQWVRIDCDERIEADGSEPVILGFFAQCLQQLNGSGGPLSPYATHARIGLEWLDANGGVIATQRGNPNNGETFGVHTGFVWISFVVTAPGAIGATHLRVFLEAQGPAGSTANFDGITYRVGHQAEEETGGGRTSAGTVPNAAPGVPVSPTAGVPVPPSDASRAFSRNRLPKSSEAAVDGAGRLTRSFYTWAGSVDDALSSALSLVDEAKAIVEAIPPALGATDGRVGSIPAPARQVVVRGDAGVISRPVDDGYLVSLENLETAEGGTLQRITIDGKGRVIETGDPTTDDLPEGTTNLYYTDERVDARIAAAGGSYRGAIGCTFDGGGSAIAVGSQCDVMVPFDCTITKATMLANQTGSVVVDVWADSFGNYPPTVADAITASARPTISSGIKSEDATLAGWSKTLPAGATVRFNVDSCADITRVTLILEVLKA